MTAPAHRGIRCERGHLSELPPGVRATHCPVPMEGRPCGLPVVPALVPPGAAYLPRSAR